MYLQPFAARSDGLFFLHPRRGDLWQIPVAEARAKHFRHAGGHFGALPAGVLPRAISYIEARDEIAVTFCTPLPNLPIALRPKVWRVSGVSSHNPSDSLIEIDQHICGIMGWENAYLIAAGSPTTPAHFLQLGNDHVLRQSELNDLKVEDRGGGDRRKLIEAAAAFESPQLFRCGEGFALVDSFARSALIFGGQPFFLEQVQLTHAPIGRRGGAMAVLDSGAETVTLKLFDGRGTAAETISVWGPGPWETATTFCATDEAIYVLDDHDNIYHALTGDSRWHPVVFE